MSPNQPSTPGRVDWERVNEVLALDKVGKTEEALSALREILVSANEDEDRANILLLIASLHGKMREYNAARNISTQVLSIVERCSEIYARALYVSASTDVNEGKWRSGLEKLEVLDQECHQILASPDNAYLLEDVARNKGIALYRLGKSSEALPWLEQAIKADYEKALALYYLGRCCYDLGDLDNSKQALQEAITLGLSTKYAPGAHYMLGLVHYWQGQSARAVNEYEWCLRQDREERVPKQQVLTALVDAFKALGVPHEVQRYSEMLRRL
jgi:tetratricopeptide (TPR) repeat protein